jgi:CBS domain-containing protein
VAGTVDAIVHDLLEEPEPRQANTQRGGVAVLVQDCCRRKVVTAEPHLSVRQVAQIMETEGVGTVVVADGSELFGLLSDRDIALHVLIERLDAEAVQARDLMHTPVVTVPEETSLGRAARVLRMHAARRLPVINGEGKLVGMIGSDDLVGLLSRKLVGLSRVIENQRPTQRPEEELGETIDRSE